MFKLIGGINTAGKTMYLEDLYLSDAASYNFIGYDNDRIRNSETCRELPVVEASDNRVFSHIRSIVQMRPQYSCR